MGGINFNPNQIGNIDPNSKNSKNPKDDTTENDTASEALPKSTSIDPDTVMNFLAAGSVMNTFKQAPTINVSKYVDANSKSRIANSMQSFESLHSDIINGLDNNASTASLSSNDKSNLALQVINKNFMPSNS